MDPVRPFRPGRSTAHECPAQPDIPHIVKYANFGPLLDNHHFAIVQPACRCLTDITLKSFSLHAVISAHLAHVSQRIKVVLVLHSGSHTVQISRCAMHHAVLSLQSRAH